MKPIAHSASSMTPSGVREIVDLATTVPGVIHLEIGEPNFETPGHIVEAAARAAADGYTKYTTNRGLYEVREAMASKIARHNGFTVDPDQIVITTGAVNGLMLAVLVLSDPTDTVLIPDPAWPNYEMMTSVVGTRLARYPLLRDGGYEPDLEALEARCRATPDAKAILMNSPGNPTGAVLRRESIAGLLDIASRYDLYLISDECYEDIVFEGEHVSPASLDTEGRVITIFSMSKSYAMTGWRIGYLAANPSLALTISNVQEAVTSCATAFAQKAAQAAIEGDQSCVAGMRDAYHERRDAVADVLADAGLLIHRSRGSFHIMADTSATGMNGFDLAKRMIVEYGVAVAPGETFGPGGAGSARISLVSPVDRLVEGVGRFVAAVEAWS
jgi:aspartate aminotransferase/aminotransferase